jgi:hypothetical protein
MQDPQEESVSEEFVQTRKASDDRRVHGLLAFIENAVIVLRRVVGSSACTDILLKMCAPFVDSRFFGITCPVRPCFSFCIAIRIVFRNCERVLDQLAACRSEKCSCKRQAIGAATVLVSPARILELRDQGLTLRDIAARCGVSKTSVIRALNQQ